ncbi:MAG TPA: branched-chain amino acid ABC transporter permease [Mycobacteriales bacterium]|nr:branched-chain amino acid ABC transporter permease [Mycobacteriales bacterium]
MSRFWDLTLGGLSSGATFAAIALSLVLIWRATRVVNFAQGGMAMITTFIGYEVIHRGGSYWLGFAVALASGLVLGAVTERVLIRPVERKPPLNAVIVTLGLLILLEAVAGMVWGATPRSFPFAFDFRGAFSPSDTFAVAAVAGAALLLLVLFQATATGLRMRAAAFEPEVARMLGVRVGRVLTLGWALAAVAGSLAGLLAAPPFISPNGLDALLVFGFTAAVIGGLDSPIGAVLGGLVLGLALSYVSGYLGADVVAFGSLVILVAVLMVRPSGVFGRTGSRQV